MKRKIVMGLLAVGAVVGLSAGFTGYSHRHHRAERAAEVCVDAALAVAHGEARPERVSRFDRKVAEVCADEARRRVPAS